MLSKIPKAEDFKIQGTIFLNQAWEYIVGLVFEEAEKKDRYSYSLNTLEDNIKEFWEKARPILRTSYALVQQASELLLKGKIAEISPFLLIKELPSRWPKGCYTESKEVSFNECFRTLDAQDLTIVYNTIFSAKLTDDFLARYESRRRDRNIIMHSASKNLRIEIEQIIKDILEIVQCLFEKNKWLYIRREHLNESVKSIYSEKKELQDQLMKESEFLINSLSDEECKRYLGFDKTITSYICPNCDYATSHYYLAHPVHQGAEERRRNFMKKRRIAFAQFISSDQSEKLWCFCCSEYINIQRKACKHDNCDCDVIHYRDTPNGRSEICLSCLRYQIN